MFDIGGQMIQEHHVEQHAHHLRQGWIFLARFFDLVLSTFAANADGEDLLALPGE